MLRVSCVWCAWYHFIAWQEFWKKIMEGGCLLVSFYTSFFKFKRYTVKIELCKPQQIMLICNRSPKNAIFGKCSIIYSINKNEKSSKLSGHGAMNNHTRRWMQFRMWMHIPKALELFQDNTPVLAIQQYSNIKKTYSGGSRILIKENIIANAADSCVT